MDQQKKHSGQARDERDPDDILVTQRTADIPVVTAGDGRRPAPFVPDFVWRPGVSDYPVPLIRSTASMRRQATVGDPNWSEGPTLDTVGHQRTPARYIPHALAVAAIVAAVMSNGLWLNRSDTPSNGASETPAAVVVGSEDDAEDEAEAQGSLLDRTQQPGQGGIDGDPTATVTTEADEDEDQDDSIIIFPTPQNGATGTGEVSPQGTERPLIPNPDNPSSVATVVVPEAGAVDYVTDEGETLLDIASEYGLSVATLLWPNDISDPAAELDEGTELVIPPVDGVLHTVRSSDTIESIAARYSVSSDVIVDFDANGIGGSPSLSVGQFLMVPGGTIADWGEVQEYTVREGDNLWIIADYYGLDPQSLAWANILPRPELISPGQVLEIPPGDGALITVEAGDHVEAIAARFEVDASTIRNYAFNNLGGDRVLQVGQKLLIPGAPLPDLDTASPTELDADTVAGEGAFNPATGGFIWPTDGFISQEYHGHHNGLDIANKEWTPINAADGGIVIFAGWNDYGLGYAVGIDHGNGYQTWYGHLLNQPYVEVGQVVWQGGYLGPMGSTGKSTGPHLHFVVMQDGAYQNPMDYLQ